MSTFSESQRHQLTLLWSQRAERDNIVNINKRIHDEEQQLIRQEKEKRISSKTKKREEARKRKGDISDEHAVPNVVRDRSQELAAKSRNRLSFSRFRSMNEFLYTHPTNDAVHFMDEHSFDLYHAAYSEIADKWPVRPIDHICRMMRAAFKKKGFGKVFADMGCGSKPLIAEAFDRATVHSFDLISRDPRITSADVSNLPLPNAVCDCVVFSLSLMGSNIAEQIREGSRILKQDGLMIIAEVTSRFKEEQSKKSKAGKKTSKNEKDCEEEETTEEVAEEAQIDSTETFVSKLSKLGLQLKKSVSLEPNNFFVVFEFARTSTSISKNKKNLPDIRLKACQYKPR